MPGEKYGLKEFMKSGGGVGRTVLNALTGQRADPLLYTIVFNWKKLSRKRRGNVIICPLENPPAIRVTGYQGKRTSRSGMSGF